MNNERYNQIIDEVYKNYEKNIPNHHVVGSDSDPMNKCMVWNRKIDSLSGYPILERLSKEEFINKCKTNLEFSEKWGLKIEERELSLGERGQWCQDFLDWDLVVGNLDHDHIREDVEENAPIKLITVTYKDEKIEVYE